MTTVIAAAIQREDRSVVISGDNNTGVLVGILHGDINVYNSKRDKQPDPFSTAPVTGRDYFTGREGILEELRRQLLPVTGTHNRVALVGKGGVGKTQIAIEFCATVRADYPDTWIIWVDAGSEAEFKRSFEEFALRAEIPEANDPKSVDILDTVSAWLQTNGPWLMVIDNNDDAELLFKQRESAQSGSLTAEKALNRYLPECDNGAILITTRDAVAGQRLCYHKPGIDVEEMLESESMEFFSKYGEEEGKPATDEKELKPLLQELEHLPLAILQAKAYIIEKQISVVEYSELLKDCEENFVELLGKDLADGRPARSVMKTWIVSFELIKSRTPRATELLSFMAFLHNAAIPKKLIAQEGEIRSIKFTDAIGELKAFRFITADDEGTSFSMHRLVQVATKEWLNAQDTIKYRTLTLEAVNKEFPDVTKEEPHKTLTSAQLYLHADAVLSYTKYEPSVLITKADLLHNASFHASDQGSFGTAKKWMEEAVKIREEKLGFENIKTVYSLNNLAQAYVETGNHRKGLEIQKIAVEKFERVPDYEDKKTEWLISMSQLANMHMAVGNWAEALQLSERSIELSDEDEEPIDNILPRKMQLAEIYRDTGKFDQAQKLAEEVIQAARSNFEADDLRISSYVRLLALIYLSQGKFGEATKLALEVMDAVEKEYGKEDPRTVDAASDLALIYEAQGEFGRAQDLGEWAVALSASLLGENHPSTLITRSNLFLVYEKTGQLEKAEKEGKVVVEASKTTFGETNPQTLRAMGTLASVYRSRGKLNEAANLGKKVLRLRKSALREGHPDILLGVINLCQTYLRQAKFDEIRKVFSAEVAVGGASPAPAKPAEKYTVERENTESKSQAVQTDPIVTAPVISKPQSTLLDTNSALFGFIVGILLLWLMQEAVRSHHRLNTP